MVTEYFERRNVVPSEYQGQRIDRVLAVIWTETSRTQIHRWIDGGELTVNGDTVKASYRVLGGEVVEVRAALPASMQWNTPDAQVSFEILFEDEHLLVVDKPSGVVTHPGKGNEQGTLVNGLLHHRPELSALPRAGIVHRLDKDTSGLLVIGGTSVAQAQLISAVSVRKIERHYLSVVEGILDQHTRIKLPLGRHRTSPTRQQVRTDGKAAETEFFPIEHFRRHTLVEAHLHSGRTHQIRVHAQSMHRPIVGDGNYGARGVLPKAPTKHLIECIRNFSRHALHAKWLKFSHPITQATMEFESHTPRDIQQLIHALREDREQTLELT